MGCADSRRRSPADTSTVGPLSILIASNASLARAVQHAVGRRGVLGFERRAHHVAGLAAADSELADLVDRERRRGALEHARQLRRQRDRTKRRRRFRVPRLQVTVQPAVRRALHAGRRRFHVVLRVEMRPRVVGRTAGVNDGELPRVPERLQRREARIESEEAVEIDRGVVAGAGPRDRDARPRPVVFAFAERYDDAQAVDGAALKDRDELLGAAGGPRERCPREERRREPEADKREARRFSRTLFGKSWSPTSLGSLALRFVA